MKTAKFLGLSVGMAFLMFACGPKPQGEDAQVSEAQTVEKPAETSKSYALSTTESSISWIGSKVTGKHTGTFGLAEGNIAVDGDQIVGGKFTIDMKNILCEDLKEDQESHDKIVGHLKSADFFDVATHPTAEFEVTQVQAFNPEESMEVKEEYESEFKPAAANEHMIENPTHKITGNLTMRGTTLGITFPAKVVMEGGTIKAMAKFNIDRTLWNVKYGDEASVADKAKDKFVYNTVNVGFDIVANTPAM